MTYRFFALPESFRDERVLLDSGETRHLRDVLRLTEGANVNVFDGCGREFSCTVVEIKKVETELLVLSELSASSPESSYELTLAAAMLKGEKFDLVVQKAVECIDLAGQLISAILVLRFQRRSLLCKIGTPLTRGNSTSFVPTHEQL